MKDSVGLVKRKNIPFHADTGAFVRFVNRVTDGKYGDKVRFFKKESESGFDEYALRAKDGVIEIEATSGVAGGVALNAYLKKYSVFLVNLHETSTGQLYDIELIKKFCQKNDILLVVDAISTFLADDFSMRKNGIDVAIISSQKGLCLSAGLAFVAMSERMTERCRSIEMHGDCYFRFIDYLANME